MQTGAPVQGKKGEGSRPGVDVTVFRITGKQLFFQVSQSVCEECELTVKAVEDAISELHNEGRGVTVNFQVKPWANNLPVVLLRGGYHPPVLLVDGKVVTQGVVPTVQNVKRAILERAHRKVKRR